VPTSDPPDPAVAQPRDADPATDGAGLLATARTVVVTAAVVAGTLLAGGYAVRAVTRSDHGKTPTTVNTSTGGNQAPTIDDGHSLPPMRGGRRPGGGDYYGPPGGTVPPGRVAPPGGATTPGTGQA
jgi:hypothetical protein